MHDSNLVVFDCNGTLASTPFVDTQLFHVFDGRRTALDLLRLQHIKVALATNQAGVLWRAATGNPKYPTTRELADDLALAARELGMGQEPIIISLYDERAVNIMKRNAHQLDPALTDSAHVVRFHLLALKQELHDAIGGRFHDCISVVPAYRKPAPGMLLFAMQWAGVSASETLYVGDRPEDEAAAQNAGCDFMWADEFFSAESENIDAND